MNRFKSEPKKKEKKSFKIKLPKGLNIEMNTQSKRSIGIVLIMLSVFMFLAFISFIGTYKADFGIVNTIKGEYLTNVNPNETEIPSNWMGHIGAILAYKFVYTWFGFAAFIFPIFLAIWALRFAFDIRLKNQLVFNRIGFFILLWLPIMLSLMAKGKADFIAGGYGVYMMLWLKTIIGAPGLVLFLVGTLITFLLMALNFDVVDKILGNKSNQNHTETENKTHSNNKPAIDKNEDPPTIKRADVNKTVDFSDEPEEAEKDDDLNFEISYENKKQTAQPKAESKSDTIEKSDEFEINTQPGDTEQAKKLIHSDDYDPKLDLSNYKHPGLELLKEYEQSEPTISKSELEDRKNLIVETLANYKIDISKVKATIGPTVTLFEIVPAPGVRISKIKNLEDDIALSLAALGIRIIAPIPGKGTVGIEVPNVKPEVVSMHDVISSSKFQTTDMALPIAFGRTISNEVFVTDLTKMPHLLMAGATGQGKSVGLNAIITSILYKKHPSQVKFVMVDPKKVELSLYKLIEKHFLAKLPDEEEAIITDTSKVINTLNALCIEMDERYDLLKEAQVRNIKEYNAKFLKRKLNPEKGHRFMPYIVLIIDELADLMMTAGKEVEMPIARLAQLARAIGIHLVVATQRPSVNIITGIIKANFPARLAFRVTSKIDSRTILDTGGADQLIGRGDMLFTTGGDLTRVQCAFVDTPEVENICEFIGDQQGYPTAFELPEAPTDSADSSSSGGGLDNDEVDALFDDAARTIVQNQMGSTSLLQRRLKLGYNRAGRLIDQLERAGVVGQHEGSKAREVLIPDEYTLEQFLNDFHNNRK
ncbi:MAG: DNA translocase FtsK 4TM domain-containing protein [Bacteroidia bacterium]